MNSTMVTAIEHHNQQQPQSSQYGVAGIQTSNLNSSGSRGPKSPHVNLANGLVSPGRGGGGGQSKKAAAAAAAAAKASLSLQTKISGHPSAKSESPRTAMSSPGGVGNSPTLERPGRGVKRSREEEITAVKVKNNNNNSM
jgi:hypothetical protein